MFKNRSFLVKLVNDKEAPETEPVERDIYVGQIIDHFKKYGILYAVGAAGIAYHLSTRGDIPQVVGDGLNVTADHGISVVGKKVVMSNVSYISSNRQGPPSWVIRCLETNEIFTSQRAAAITKGISETNLSQHLNGKQSAVDGLTFERICMAA